MVCQGYSRSGTKDNLIDIIRLLVKCDGIDVNNTSFGGWNALMSVCRYYSHANLKEIVQFLVSFGIDVNSRTINGSNDFLLLCENE